MNYFADENRLKSIAQSSGVFYSSPSPNSMLKDSVARKKRGSLMLAPLPTKREEGKGRPRAPSLPEKHNSEVKHIPSIPQQSPRMSGHSDSVKQPKPYSRSPPPLQIDYSSNDSLKRENSESSLTSSHSSSAVSKKPTHSHSRSGSVRRACSPTMNRPTSHIHSPHQKVTSVRAKKTLSMSSGEMTVFGMIENEEKSREQEYVREINVLKKQNEDLTKRNEKLTQKTIRLSVFQNECAEHVATITALKNEIEKMRQQAEIHERKLEEAKDCIAKFRQNTKLNLSTNTTIDHNANTDLNYDTNSTTLETPHATSITSPGLISKLRSSIDRVTRHTKSTITIYDNGADNSSDVNSTSSDLTNIQLESLDDIHISKVRSSSSSTTLTSQRSFLKAKQLYNISNIPSDYSSLCHVTVDRQSNYGIAGLPADVELVLENGGIVKDDVLSHSSEILGILSFLAAHNQLPSAHKKLTIAGKSAKHSSSLALIYEMSPRSEKEPSHTRSPSSLFSDLGNCATPRKTKLTSNLGNEVSFVEENDDIDEDDMQQTQIERNEYESKKKGYCSEEEKKNENRKTIVAKKMGRRRSNSIQTTSEHTKRNNSQYTNSRPQKKVTLHQLLDSSITIDHYSDLKLIGVGSGGFVYEATEKQTQKKVALKLITVNPHNAQRLCYEIDAMKTLRNHKNIVEFFTAFQSNNSQIYVAMELLDMGSLTDLIDRFPDIKMEEKHISYVCREVVHGLLYMHNLNKIHRDIKSDNILLNRNGQIKLADFGFTTQLTEKKDKRRSFVGTPYWMAPEIIKAEEYDARVDVWSLGVTVYEMLLGDPPYVELPQLKALLAIATKGFPPVDTPLSDELKNFIKITLNLDPHMRADTSILSEHCFLKKSCSSSEFADFAKDTLAHPSCVSDDEEDL